MQKHVFFPYDWKIDNREINVTSIRIYGIDESNCSVCVRTDNFTPFVYLELPDDIAWDENSINKLSFKIDDLLKDKKPLFKSLETRKRLYYAHMDKKGKRKEFPYLFLAFSNKADIRMLAYKIRTPLNVAGIGRVKLKMHEQDASEILQLTCRTGISIAGWIKFTGGKVSDEDKLTICDYEFLVDWKNLTPYKSDKVPKPKIMSLDLEVYSSDPNTLPTTERLGDKIFQASCVVGRQGEPDEKAEKTLLTFGDPDPAILGKDIKFRTFNTEDDLLLGLRDFILETRPNIIIGYNIFGFDIPYLISRAISPCMCFKEFAQLGMIKDREANTRTIKWSSSAYGTQEFEFLDAEGILFVDLLPLVRREYKMDTYSLKSISTYFLGETKDPLTHKGIFKCYDIGTKRKPDGTFSKNAQKAIAICGKYCVQDSALVLKLFEKLQTWIGLIEMAKVTNVPIFALYTQGQQIRVFSQVYKLCMYDGYVVEKDGYTVGENEHYTGAHVFEPVPGLYEDVVPFDFSSLYPTTIIAHNICWSTLVIDETIPDNLCHVFDWEDHQGCVHDKVVRKTRPKYIMCTRRRYRFLKEPKGILPRLLSNLLEARAHTKDLLKQIKSQLKTETDHNIRNELELQLNVLDKRQNAFKVSANSGYGIMGVQRGYLPFMPGAMCTTAKGRESIEKAANHIITKHGGILIYGDTDSSYVHFPNMKGKTAKELWEHCIQVAKDTSTLFPKPMALLFEEKIFRKFFIITKKRYMSLTCDKDGVLSDEISKKGVILARRDNAKIVRDIYSDTMMKVFNNATEYDVHLGLIDKINAMFCGEYPHTDFIITKSVKGCNGLTITDIKDEPVLDKDGVQKKDKNGNLMVRRTGKIGEYKIPLWRNEEEKKKKLTSKKVSTVKDYYLKCLPAQAQLAEKMRRRGKPVSDGSRLEYVMLTDGSVSSVKDKKYEKIESAEYYVEHKDLLKIDYLIYLDSLASSLDQVMDVVYKCKGFVNSQYQLRLHKLKVMQELKDLFKPTVLFEGEEVKSTTVQKKNKKPSKKTFKHNNVCIIE